MITHDRWQQIKEIFYSAQDRPPAERSDYLDEVCGDDASMREEVEALLTADADNENFLTSPAYEFAAGMLSDEASEFAADETVGRYKILCRLGAGGMGQIYLAHDAQLGRNIALKLITQEFATDSRRVLRFEQEARAASALNHPNVCVIHEIGITDTGRHFIAMEYIQGATLRDHLARGPLKLLDALQIAIQVGAALASAHAVGIVHRDIKPENIMLRPDGYVKVVDFGLAKLTEILPQQQSGHDVQTVVLTEPRILMGTVKYMSPEQLREKTVDERTDIWSLGVVLNEMLTGETPFDAKARNDSVAMILRTEPAQLTFPETVPLQYQEIVKKALEKDPDQRYQTITRLTSDLKSLTRELERNSSGGTQASHVFYTPVGSAVLPKPRFGSTLFTRLKSQANLTADSLRTHKAAAIFAGTGVLGLLVTFSAITRWANERANTVRTGQQTTATVFAEPAKALTYDGKSVCSAISHDGKWVAHAEDQKGKQRLVVTNIANGGSSILPPGDFKYLGITFSPDSNYLYFTRTENNGPGTLYQLAWPGNNPVKLKTGVEGPISFSPQGDRFAFVRHDKTASEFLLMLSNVDGSNEQVLASRKNGDRFSTYGPAWSPDGSLVVCPTSYWDNGYHTNLVGFNPNDRHERRIGSQSWFLIAELAWQDDMGSLVVSARERKTSPRRLWRISFPDGAAEMITPDLNDYAGVSLSGNKIVTVGTKLSWNIWVETIGESQKAPAVSIAPGVGTNYGLCWTGTRKIVFSSVTGDQLNISRIDLDSFNRVQLTNVGDNYLPACSADGRFIVFASNRNGPFNIWRMNVDDPSDLKQLTFSDGNFYPSVSPDNQWVAYDHVADSGVSVWRVSIHDGDSIKVTENYRMPAFSPDSQTIACRYNLESGTHDAAIFSAEDGQPLRHFEIPNQEWQRVQWISNRELSYIANVNGLSNIWSYNLDTGTSKQLTLSFFNSDQIYAYAWSPDHKQVACQRGTNVGDVTMISER
jgi:serine/threonine protein kinase